MSKDKNIKLKSLLKEAFGALGVVTHAHPNRKRLQEAEPGMPGAPVPTRPSVQTARPQQRPTPPARPQVRPMANDVPEEPQEAPAPPTPKTLNYKVQPGFKVEFEGKPGQYYIIRIMNTAMTNFLVVNDKVGKPIQFINVGIERIDSDEKGKPYKGEL